jgi:hypothetical protein
MQNQPTSTKIKLQVLAPRRNGVQLASDEIVRRRLIRLERSE